MSRRQCLSRRSEPALCRIVLGLRIRGDRQMRLQHVFRRRQRAGQLAERLFDRGQFADLFPSAGNLDASQPMRRFVLAIGGLGPRQPFAGVACSLEIRGTIPNPSGYRRRPHRIVMGRSLGGEHGKPLLPAHHIGFDALCLFELRPQPVAALYGGLVGASRPRRRVAGQQLRQILSGTGENLAQTRKAGGRGELRLQNGLDGCLGLHRWRRLVEPRPLFEQEKSRQARVAAVAAVREERESPRMRFLAAGDDARRSEVGQRAAPVGQELLPEPPLAAFRLEIHLHQRRAAAVGLQCRDVLVGRSMLVEEDGLQRLEHR